MNVTKTVEIPADHRLVIEVPAEVPAGQAVITFTPASPNTDNDPLPTGECPICAVHNYMPNAKTIAAIKEGDAILRGEIPGKWYDSTDEMWEDLMKDESDDDLHQIDKAAQKVVFQRTGSHSDLF